MAGRLDTSASFLLPSVLILVCIVLRGTGTGRKSAGRLDAKVSSIEAWLSILLFLGRGFGFFSFLGLVELLGRAGGRCLGIPPNRLPGMHTLAYECVGGSASVLVGLFTSPCVLLGVECGGAPVGDCSDPTGAG